MKLKERIQHAWNSFRNADTNSLDYGYSSWSPTFKTVKSYSSTSFVSSVYNRIAIDVSMATLKHVKVNLDNEDEEVINSGLNYCLNTEANIDQSHIAFIHDLTYSMFDEGSIAVVPVDTSISPDKSGGYDIKTMRVGKVTQWYPNHVRVNLYNDRTGQNEDIIIQKSNVALIENPLYAVMNGENSTLKRLVAKMKQLDISEELASSGKMDLIIQVPFGIKTNTQKRMAEDRIKALEQQLSMGKHGIAYMDATEKVTQLNRPIESQLPATIEALKDEFYNQLGLTETIFNGTAKEEELRIYYSRTIDPIIKNIIAELERKFLTKTARTQGHAIHYNRDMFKFVTIERLSSLGDTVRRNSIMTSNELRKILGLGHSDDPRADELFNPNIADKNQNRNAPLPKPTGSLTPPDEPNLNE